MKNKNKSGVFIALKATAKSHPFLSVGILLCVAMSVTASLVPPLLLAKIIDELTAGFSLSVGTAAVYFLSLVAESLFSSAQETLLVIFGQKTTCALRLKMYQKLTKLPAGTLVEQNSGEVVARFSGDVDTVEALFTSGIIGMVTDIFRIISILAVIAVKNTGLWLFLSLILPIFALFTRRMQKRTFAAQIDHRRAIADVSSQIPETIRNIRTIRALGAEGYMERRYNNGIDKSYAAMEKTNFYDAVYSPIVILLNVAIVCVVMLLSASGKTRILKLFGMSVGTSVAVINYISRIFSPIESLGMEIQSIQSAMAGIKRIDTFLCQPEREIFKENKRVLRRDIVFSNVTFAYDDKFVLRNFSMSVKPGEHVTLIGKTGVGKSTVFRLLSGLYSPQKGTITIGGVDVRSIPDSERRFNVCCVEQRFSLISGTILEQITLGDPRISAETAKNAAKLVGVDSIINALSNGYDTICTEGLFSQGEQQLLSIARAVAAKPAVLLFDEITANLDSETEVKVIEALRRASKGCTVLSISHRVYRGLGDKIVEIKAQANK